MASGAIRTIQVRRHVGLRQALEQHVIDDEPVAARRFRDARIEWPAILRQPTHERQDARANLLLTCLRTRGIVDRRHVLRAGTQLPLRDRIQLDQQGGRGLLRVRQRHRADECDNDQERRTRRHVGLLFCTCVGERPAHGTVWLQPHTPASAASRCTNPRRAYLSCTRLSAARHPRPRPYDVTTCRSRPAAGTVMRKRPRVDAQHQWS